MIRAIVLIALLCVAFSIPPVPVKKRYQSTEVVKGGQLILTLNTIPPAPIIHTNHLLLEWDMPPGDWSGVVYQVEAQLKLNWPWGVLGQTTNKFWRRDTTNMMEFYRVGSMNPYAP